MTIAAITITDLQIRALRTEAGQAGDREQVAICNRALNGSARARAKCARAIAQAESQTIPVTRI